MKTFAAASAALVAASTAMATDTYNDLTTFLNNVQPGFYAEDFSGVPVGGAGPLLSFSDGTFSYDITATGGGSNDLFNDPGLVSTDSALDALVVTFTSGNVTAVGGNFLATDFFFLPINAEMTLTLNDGTIVNFNGSDFAGFTSNVGITSLTIDADDTFENAWSAIDDLWVGQVIPSPASFALLGMGGLLAGRRRR